MSIVGITSLGSERVHQPRYERLSPPQRETFKDFVVEIASSKLSEDSPISDKWLSEHFEEAKFIKRRGRFARHLNKNPDLAERFMENPKEVIKEALVERASTLIDDDSPITDEWLSEHLKEARLIARRRYFAEYLDENPDKAERFMEGLAEAEEVRKEADVERASTLIDDDSPITDEWLSEHLEEARFIARHGHFAEYLSEKPDEAEKFIDTSV